MKTMPLALQTIAGGAATSSVGRMGAVAASTLIMTMPTVIIFTSMQKKVMETMVHSGIKG
jgi:ABC-type glycerol-3-phosphate transport system permease component